MTTSTRRSRGLWIDLLVAGVLLAGSGVWATRFWNTWTSQGGEPVFYQIYFEPAVMVACGKGFVISEQQPKALEDFLWRRRDTFDCRELPSNLTVRRDNLYQDAWIYLQLTVGWSWRLLGISWSGMGPLFGLLFGSVIALAYAIGRLGMGRLLALACALGLAISPTHLLNLPHLRDYAKAPFTLALVLILGLLVTRPVRRPTVLLLAVAYGAVLGIGYGFRTDFLVDLPPLVIVLFAFLEGGVTRNLRLKAAATVLFLATFIAVSWPVLSQVYKNGGCQWHVALLGLQSPFDENLRIAPAPYDFGYAYADGYVVRGVQGYAHRTQPEAPPPIYCSHEYDVYSGRYLRDILFTFPGDLVVRAYASAIQIVQLPFLGGAPPVKDWANSIFQTRAFLLTPWIPRGAYIADAAVLVTSAVSIRLGIFLLFFLAYFGGYPAIQFQERHYFHLEFMTWWAMGFVVHHAIAAIWSLRAKSPDIKQLVRPVVRAAALAISAVIVFASLLGVARWYQTRQVRQLFDAYIAAPKAALKNLGDPLPDVAARDWPQYLEVELNDAACGNRPAVTFRYDPVPDGDFTRTVAFERRAGAAGQTRIFLPVFERYTGLEFGDVRPDCVVGAYRFTDLRPFPLVLGATLPPEWQALPLHQRLADWERDRAGKHE